MPTVYVINKGSHDFSDAERFGNIVFLTEGPINRFAVGQMMRLFTKALKSSKPEDYILPTGLSVMTALACSVFATKHRRLNLLLWKHLSPRGSYVERIINFEHLEEE